MSYSEFADYLMIDNAEKRPYVMSEEEMVRAGRRAGCSHKAPLTKAGRGVYVDAGRWMAQKRKHVILHDCIMFSDVKPRQRQTDTNTHTFKPPEMVCARPE